MRQKSKLQKTIQGQLMNILLQYYVAIDLTLLVIITGCISTKNDNFILDNKFLETLSKRGIDNGVLQIEGQSKIYHLPNGVLYIEDQSKIYHLTVEQSNTIIEAFLPVSLIQDEVLPMLISYTFSFQQGMHPASFAISVEKSNLVFYFDGRTYSGGSSEDFQTTVDKIKLGQN